jgi:DNA-binding NtrC family response regulator
LPPTLPAVPPQLLLVDDEPRILGSLCELLKHRGFILTTAATGNEALRKLSQEPFDLVILDLRLPDISGHEIMDFMNAREIDANVIVTSGDAGIDAAIGALKRGAYDYLRKPYSREELFKGSPQRTATASTGIRKPADSRPSWSFQNDITAIWLTARPTLFSRSVPTV